MKPVVVVGTGIVGASIAYHLARRGVPVTVIGRDAGVTASSFAWIGGDEGGDWPGGAADLAGLVLADWRRVQREVSGIGVRWTGSLRWPITAEEATQAEPPGPAVPVSAVPGSAVPGSAVPGSAVPEEAGLMFLGQPMGAGGRLVGPEAIASLEPHLRTFPEQAVYRPGDGGVDPVRAARAFLLAARDAGARVVPGATAVEVSTAGVGSTAGFHPASTVVLAAGTGSVALARRAGSAWTGQQAGSGEAVARMAGTSPAMLVRVRARRAGLVRGIVVGPGFEVREVRERELLMAASLGDTWSWSDLRDTAGQALGHLRTAFGDGLRPVGWRVGVRPMPVGGPVIGRLSPYLYVAVMHSGVCLAPSVGRLVASEISSGAAAPELARCRPPAG
ncbi:NAD(P)/FAD-dependent oxidoreductase [Paractinoplanes toevensis]|uniref:D-amino-acid oxidase n=1 Tax=Paractinoplanes toevensis TaxID=571911 RepID=A0A919W8P4_9ACTN|nr:FAD-binding oxidoreductase [Actinoplanes toevensis]GIM94926.1 D-amino-acid oxidase [Actinoplanes toevensis]